MNKKIISLLLAVIMAVSLLAACGQSAQTGGATTAATTAAQTTAAAATTQAATTTTTAKAEPDLPFVELNFYFMGEVGNDMDEFHAIFDEWTLRDFNCKVNFKHANTWIDYAAKYNLMLTADDTIDLCYAANWIDFYSYAKKDAFEDITDLLPQYCPDIWAAFPRDQFNGATVNGKIYGVPQKWTNYHGENFVYREDLRKKYDVPEIDLSWESMETYMQTILENEEFPFAITYQYNNPVSHYLAHLTKYDGIDNTAIAMISERGTKNTMMYYDDPSYVDFARRMKRWCDLGFWSKSILATADSTDHGDLFKEELIFVTLNSHVDRFQGIAEDAAKDHPDWEIGAIPLATLKNVFYHTRMAQDLTCIPNGSKNPERALMVFNKMMMDPEYYELVMYGMKGLNFNLDGDGYVTYEGIDTTARRFDLCLWAMRNEDLAFPVARNWDRKSLYEDKWFPKLVFDPFDGFAIDLENIQAEHTALNQVMKEYADPIQFGIVPDPDGAVETLRQKMKEAGVDKFKAEIDKQLSAYLDSKG